MTAPQPPRKALERLADDWLARPHGDDAVLAGDVLETAAPLRPRVDIARTLCGCSDSIGPRTKGRRGSQPR